MSPPKKPRPNSGSHQGRDYDLNEIRSELKGFNTVKQEPDEIKQEPADKDASTAAIPLPAAPAPDPPQPDKQAEDVYEFKEPEPFELELHDEKKKRTHRIFDDISPNKYTSTLSKSLSEEISEDPMRPRPSSLRSPSLSPFRDFGGTRETGQSPEDDSKDGSFSLDDDSFHGDGSSGPTFEGFTPAKNQETYSKKSKVSKLRKLIDDSPDSPADDEQSSDDEPDDVAIKEEDEEERERTPVLPSAEQSKSPVSDVKEDVKEPEQTKDIIEDTIIQDIPLEILNIPKPPTTPPSPQLDPEFLKKIELPKTIEIPKEETPKKIENPKKIETPKKIEQPKKVEHPKKIETIKKVDQPKKVELPKLEMPKMTIIPPVTASTSTAATEVIEKIKQESKEDEQLKLMSIPLPTSEPKEMPIMATPKKVEKLDPEPIKSILEPPSSPLIDTEEDKSEPDSPARIDVLPEPPPGFKLQSEGPKIAEKLLKAISSAKRLSMSPPPVIENRPDTPKTDSLKVIKPESKLSPTSPEPRTSALKTEPVKPVIKVSEPTKKLEDSIFGEPVNLLDVKRDVLDIKKKSEERTSPRLQSPRLQSPLNILERRKSVADLPLSVPGKNNKVLSDTIQKLSSQINQAAASVAAIPLPAFPAEDRSESSDSDDSDRR